jgi:hypothetical protein
MEVDVFLVLVFGESPAEIHSLLDHLDIKGQSGLYSTLRLFTSSLGGPESPLPF